MPHRSLNRRIAVVDIGSNTIRLVVYHDGSRAPLPLFNEKILCGLGRGLAGSGRLNEDGVRQALANLGRFREVARAIGAEDVHVVATAAVRDAANGPAFVAEAERLSGLTVQVISGDEEARLSALGVLSTMPDADGVAGDLGGGSLELVRVAGGASGEQLRVGDHVSLQLGPLRLMETTNGDLGLGRTVINRALRGATVLQALEGRNFYAVGGAWRAIARLMMEVRRYPLHIIHHYGLDADEARDFLARFRRWSRDDLRKLAPDLPRRRLDALPWAGVVLEQVLAQAAPKRLVFSAYGLREGVLFDLLPDEEREKDPLLVGCSAMAGEARFALTAADLMRFIEPIFPKLERSRLRLLDAASRLADLAWMEHPDYRAEHAYRRALRMPLVGLDHAGRAFLALAVAARYGADASDAPDDVAARLLDQSDMRSAVECGLALRLAYTLSGGAPSALNHCHLSLEDGAMVLTVPKEGAVVLGDAVVRRFEALARRRGLSTRIEGPGAVANAA